MRMGRLMRYLRKWQQSGLINEDQVVKISDYMKIERHRQFLKLIKILFVIGAFWLFVGVVATLRLINIEIFVVIGEFLYNLVSPIIKLVKSLSPQHYGEILGGLGCFLGWGVFQWLGMVLRKKSDLRTTQLGYFQEKELRLGTTSFTLGYILASWGLQLFNYATYPKDPYLYLGKAAIFPLFSFLGIIFFMMIAYFMEDQIALLFGIAFLAHAVGLFTTYFTACYVIGVQFPAIQLLVGILLLFVGLFHVEKSRFREDSFLFMFGRTYEWTGILFAFISLWIMSIWGFTFKENYFISPMTHELWMANILFMAACLTSLFYGAVKEDKMFFNYGLTFLIIDSYTLFFSHVWSTLGSALSSLMLGVMLIVTGYILRDLWLKGKIFSK